MSKQKIKKEELEKMYGKCVATMSFSIDDEIFTDGKVHTLIFDIYDGFAYCADYQGDEYIMQYPQLAFIKVSDKMSDMIREFNEMEATQAITPIEVINTYGKLYKI